MDDVRSSDGADFLAHPVLHFLVQFGGRYFTGVEGDIGIDALALDVVRHTNHRRFGDFRVRHQCRFNFGGAHAVAGYVKHVIHPAGDPVIAVFVTTGTVTTEVGTGEGREVGLLETVVITEDGTHLTRPGVQQHQVAVGGAAQHIAFAVDQRRLYTEEGTSGRAGLEVGSAGQRSDQNAAGLGLPPGIHDGAALVTNHPVIPFPGFRVDGLAHRAQNAQAGAAGAFYGFFTFGHEGANGGRGGIKNIDLMLVHDLGHAVGLGIVGDPFKHQGGGAVGQGAVEQIAVTGDPAHVGGTPVNVTFVVVEDVLEGHGCIHQVTAGGVQYALGSAGRAGGIENEQRIFGIHFGGRAVGADGGRGFVPPDITVFEPGHIATGAAIDDNLAVFADAGFGQGGVHVGLECYFAAAPQTFVGGDDDFGIGVDDTAGQGVRRETAEDHRMHGADAGTGQHGHGRFYHHRHIEADHVAFFHALGFQYVGKAAHLLVQLAIRYFLVVFRAVAFPDDGYFIGLGGQMTIDTVGGQVKSTVFKPLDADVAGIVRGVLDLGIGFDPVDALALLTPEFIRVLDGFLIHALIARIVD